MNQSHQGGGSGPGAGRCHPDVAAADGPGAGADHSAAVSDPAGILEAPAGSYTGRLLFRYLLY
jgi:hypothetical protein